MAKKVEWTGSKTCDFCGKECEKDLYDGQTTWGPWAVMCTDCFFKHGTGLGTGSGQHYKQKKDGRWEKVGG